MPCQMAYDVLICEAYCPYGHPQGCKKHARLNVAGKPFAMQDYREQFNQLGFTGVKAKRRPSTARPYIRRGVLPSRRVGRISARRHII
jgi:hypothetical protein